VPPLLDRHPELARSVVLRAKQNLNEPSTELLCLHLRKIAPPASLEERQAESVDELCTMVQLLGESRLAKLSTPATRRQMQCLEFKCKVRRKICYVDGHKKPETKKCRKKVVGECLENELCVCR
jgi:hypothetical protein